MNTPHDNDQSQFSFVDELDAETLERAASVDVEREPIEDSGADEDSQWAPPVRSVEANDRDDFIRLALVPGVGPKMIAALIQHFGSAAEVSRATLSQLGAVRRVGPKLATSIRDASRNDLASRVRDHCEQHAVRILLPGDAEFPRLLRELDDPPVLLFVRGTLERSDQLSIGMVGTRHCTHYGRTMAQRLSSELARYGLTIVSGLARGVDAVCHRATLESSGRTIAVLGSSVTDIYPPEHAELAEQIVASGALISETHPFSKPKAGVFPQRNRIISGLSLAVVVVEAADRSGSLITARHAGEQGRDVFAVPGPVTSRMSRGCNQLIRDGAILIQDANDIIDHLGPLVERAVVRDEQVVHHPAELQLNEIEQKVLQAIGPTPTDIDQVIHTAELPVPRVLSTLSVLERKGLIARPSGRTVVRREHHPPAGRVERSEGRASGASAISFDRDHCCDTPSPALAGRLSQGESNPAAQN